MTAANLAHNLAPRPTIKPKNPNFASGPCAKRPGWTVEALQKALLGRSHRSGEGKKRLKEVIDLSREILGIPADYRLAIVPASDTGAIEMAMWSLLGARPVDVLSFEEFGKQWAQDVTKQLRLKDVRVLDAPYGELPDLRLVNPEHDVVFCWNGTTSGVKVPHGDWIHPNRAGLVLCDATSAAFAMDLPWPRLDVVTYSWQKVLGGEAQHGMIALSPRAVARLESYTPPWPMPKLFRMTKDSKIAEALFAGETINTPSMLCVEDALDGLRWAKQQGGLAGLMKRSELNFAAVAKFVAQTPWAEFLASDPATRSNTSICVRIADPAIAALPSAQQADFIKSLCALLEKEQVAYDIAGHREAPPHLRIWGGATIDATDIEALLPWLDWAFQTARAELRLAA